MAHLVTVGAVHTSNLVNEFKRDAKIFDVPYRVYYKDRVEF